MTKKCDVEGADESGKDRQPYDSFKFGHFGDLQNSSELLAVSMSELMALCY